MAFTTTSSLKEPSMKKEATSIEAIPDVCALIVEFLGASSKSTHDVLQLALVNSHWNEHVRYSSIWEKRLKRQFPISYERLILLSASSLQEGGRRKNALQSGLSRAGLLSWYEQYLSLLLHDGSSFAPPDSHRGEGVLGGKDQEGEAGEVSAFLLSDDFQGGEGKTTSIAPIIIEDCQGHPTAAIDENYPTSTFSSLQYFLSARKKCATITFISPTLAPTPAPNLSSSFHLGTSRSSPTSEGLMGGNSLGGTSIGVKNTSMARTPSHPLHINTGNIQILFTGPEGGGVPHKLKGEMLEGALGFLGEKLGDEEQFNLTLGAVARANREEEEDNPIAAIPKCTWRQLEFTFQNQDIGQRMAFSSPTEKPRYYSGVSHCWDSTHGVIFLLNAPPSLQSLPSSEIEGHDEEEVFQQWYRRAEMLLSDAKKELDCLWKYPGSKHLRWRQKPLVPPGQHSVLMGKTVSPVECFMARCPFLILVHQKEEGKVDPEKDGEQEKEKEGKAAKIRKNSTAATSQSFVEQICSMLGLQDWDDKFCWRVQLANMETGEGLIPGLEWMEHCLQENGFYCSRIHHHSPPHHEEEKEIAQT